MVIRSIHTWYKMQQFKARTARMFSTMPTVVPPVAVNNSNNRRRNSSNISSSLNSTIMTSNENFALTLPSNYNNSIDSMAYDDNSNNNSNLRNQNIFHNFTADESNIDKNKYKLSKKNVKAKSLQAVDAETCVGNVNHYPMMTSEHEEQEEIYILAQAEHQQLVLGQQVQQEQRPAVVMALAVALPVTDQVDLLG